MNQTFQRIFSTEPSRTFPSVSDFLSNWNFAKDTGDIQVEMEEGIPLRIHWDFRNSSQTLVRFLPAPAGYFRLPGWQDDSIFPNLQCNILLLSDPTLLADAGLSHTWFESTDFCPNLESNINSILSRIGEESELLTFGELSSGFAAIKYGAVNNARIIAIEPSLTRHHLRGWNDYIESLSPKDSDLDCAATVVPESYSRRLWVFTNRTDFEYEKVMLTPFLETVPLSIDLKQVSFAAQPSDRLLTNNSLERIVEEIVSEDQQSSPSESRLQVELSDSRMKPSFERARLPRRKLEILLDESFSFTNQPKSCTIKLRSTTALNHKDLVLLFAFHSTREKLAPNDISLGWSPSLGSFFHYVESLTSDQVTTVSELELPPSVTGFRLRLARWDIPDDREIQIDLQTGFEFQSTST
ncbi:hypothetical protein L8V01_02875 [Corynebacterium sp. c8Ua_181]|uniref:Uncharacterized protein n=1 Tax=Corynebacterium curieae TaxID=2913500 RepID=A0A9X3M9Z6_9CORY|nr:hypothetical protein [Corynebacterium curieae]MCZ9306428.1 hypothetical protein [Corynebacterium curieae]MDV2424003.1 hypothetical protein [Corynebacterium curieae]